MKKFEDGFWRFISQTTNHKPQTTNLTVGSVSQAGMKTPQIRISIFSILVFMIAITFVISTISCKEDSLLSGSKEQLYDPAYQKYYELVAFHEMMEDLPQTRPILQTRSGFTSTQVRDYIEGTLNMVFTDPILTWAGYEIFKDTFSISMPMGTATEGQVEILYDDIVESVSDAYYSIAEQDKFPYLFDASIISLGTNPLLLEIEMTVGKVHKDPTPFGPTDYWSVFSGKCAPMSGSTSNAQNELNRELDNWFNPYGCVVLTNVQHIDVASELDIYGWDAVNPNDPNPGDFIIDYRTFYVECNFPSGECDALTNNGVFCLDPDEMNFYFQSVKNIYSAYNSANGTTMCKSMFGLHTSFGTNIIYKWEGGAKFATPINCDEDGEYPHHLPVDPN